MALLMTNSTKLTKIVATVGPASENEATITELMAAGLNIARFNTKHNEPSWHDQVIKRVKKVAQEQNRPTGVLLDLQGPEIRIDVPGGQAFDLAAGEEALVTSDAQATGKVMIVPQLVVDGLQAGNQILLEDGACELTVSIRTAEGIKVKAEYPCTIKHRKTMNTPGVVLDLPSLTQRDFTYLDGVDLSNVDYVGLSFVRNQHDLGILRQELDNRKSAAKIIAKIENQAALDNIDEIIAAADTVMVARGDLAVETPYEELIHWQRLIIAKCRQVGKPVITATQMLLSMVNNPRPTRAEISDVAHAVYDGTDAVMLSEETTIGKFPVKVVQAQAKIVTFTEQHPEAEPFDLTFETASQKFGQAVTADIAANQYGSVVCWDPEGKVTLDLARCHPRHLIHVVTQSAALSNELSLAFGIQPHTLNGESALNTPEEIKSILSTIAPEIDVNKPILWISARTLETKVI